jgi:hypothetical protein
MILAGRPVGKVGRCRGVMLFDFPLSNFQVPNHSIYYSVANYVNIQAE